MRVNGFAISARRVPSFGVLAVLAALSPVAAQEVWVGPIPNNFNDAPFVYAGTTGSFLGVGVAEIDTERSKKLNLKEERGVEITRVEPDSPAEKAGLKVGDVVLEYNGQRVEGTEQFVRLVRETPPGRTATMLISRGGANQTVSAAIGSRKPMVFGGQYRSFPRVEIPEIQIPDVPKAFMSWRSSRLGIEAESVDSQLAEFFGVKEGVLVRSVIRDSPADRAGIKAGDVITKIGGSPVSSPREISGVIRGLRDQKTVAVTLVREKREMSVTVTIDEDRSEWERPRGRSVQVQKFRL